MFRAPLRWFLHMFATRGALFLEKEALEKQLFKSHVIIYSKREMKVKIMKTTKRLSSFFVILGILIKLDNFQMKIKSKERAKYSSLVSVI